MLVHIPGHPWFWGGDGEHHFFDTGLSPLPPLWLSHQHSDIFSLNSSVFILLTRNTWGTQSNLTYTFDISPPQLYKHLLNKIKENLFLSQVLAFLNNVKQELRSIYSFQKYIWRTFVFPVHMYFQLVLQGYLSCFYRFLSNFQKGFNAIQPDSHFQLLPRRLSNPWNVY